jgi:aminopeptidase N
VVNKWLALQASSQLPDTLSNIKHLLTHDGFDINNPNKVYALIGTFGSYNPERFHDHSGHGYNFIADRVIELNNKNPQVASHVINGLTQWKRIEGDYGIMMKKALEKIQHSGHLSKDVNEIVTKSLQ